MILWLDVVHCEGETLFMDIAHERSKEVLRWRGETMFKFEVWIAQLCVVDLLRNGHWFM